MLYISTIAPVEDEVAPRPIHELGLVVRIERRMVEPGGLVDGHRQTSVQPQSELVKERQRSAWVGRRMLDAVQCQTHLRPCWLPAWTIRHIQ